MTVHRLPFNVNNSEKDLVSTTGFSVETVPGIHWGSSLVVDEERLCVGIGSEEI